MATRKSTPAEVLTLIAERAPALRRAGVTKVVLDGFAFNLAPDEPVASFERHEEPEVEPADPLSDPATYGRNGNVPGFLRDDD